MLYFRIGLSSWFIWLKYQELTSKTTTYYIRALILRSVLIEVRDLDDLSLESANISILLILLTLLLIPAFYFSSLDFQNSSLKGLFLSLIFLVILSFLAEALLSFYILFELRAIPIAIVIAGWGAQPERLAAVLFMLL